MESTSEHIYIELSKIELSEGKFFCKEQSDMNHYNEHRSQCQTSCVIDASLIRINQ